ncbi:MAG: 23S rRNA (uracil(1939)-C(5))-methyltransferase RlmD [Bacillota bacterium]|nr:23S rRNA (uracil(1939)-C(5))-methyltransferase RlmD [Bacillota bacterium]
MLCKIMDRCGGCLYNHDNYPLSLENKERLLKDLFPNEKIEAIEGEWNPYYYRNKVHDAFAMENNKLIMGKYEKNTKNVLETDSCLIEDINAQKINATVKDLAKSFKWSIYDVDTGQGLLRGSLVRVGKTSKEILLVVVVTDSIIPSSNNFTKAIRKAHPEITSIVFNINDRDTSMILGKKDLVAYGEGYIFDEILGLSFRISPQSFYQINSRMTERLYKTALEWGDFKATDTIVDAYCGIGTISLYASRFVKKVLGVESNLEAIKDAVFNSKNNKIKNVHFTAMDAGLYLQELKENGVEVDGIIVDPARSGLDQNALKGLLDLEAEKIIYISCNPYALKEDLEKLKDKYKVVKMKAFDMFPWTGHVETIALIQKI